MIDLGQPTHFVEIDEGEFLKDAVAIVEKSQSRGVVTRILGALAVYAHSREKDDCMKALGSMGRFGAGNPMFTDMDLICYNKQRKEVSRVLEELGFKPDSGFNWMYGDQRIVYNHPQNRYHIDIFMDSLIFSHDLHFGKKPGSGRLELDYPTISLEDLILEKLQTHAINRKDIIDLIVLFIGHDVKEQREKDVVDGGHVAKTLSDDWGFWYDATMNLDLVKKLAQEFLDSGKLPKEYVDVTIERVNRLRSIVDQTPKTKNWEKRAKTGTNKPWYRQVEEVNQDI